MKLKFLLFLSLITGIIQAQVVCDYPEGVDRSLVITEARMSGNSSAYIEITNMSDAPVMLGDFKFGHLTPWSRTGSIQDLCNDGWYNSDPEFMFLPDRSLQPGESFVITNAYDYSPKHYKMWLGRQGGSERPKQPEMYEVADKLIHVPEIIDGVAYPGDSISTGETDPETLRPIGNYYNIFDALSGGTLYLEHHYMDGDSAVIDQVGGVFDNNGRNFGHLDYDIAGVVGGVNTSVMVRKFTVKKGNIDFANARGVSFDDSEWIPLEMPEGYDSWRDLWWVTGTHGNYTLDENTLEPDDDVVVDFAGKKITVPWGTLRLDDIMRHMKKKPGIAWNYNLNPNVADSLYRGAKTGDQLTINVVGNGLQTATFDIVVNEPTADDNFVVPIDHKRLDPGPVSTNTQNGILSWPRVTRNESGTDTITGRGYGLAYDLRTDSLLKYLEKPANAKWEFVWVDGQERPDLRNGDVLKVTSQNGKVKEYYIQLQSFFPSRNARLSSITWPDIPDFYKGIFGWTGDTIPHFSSGSTNYRVQVPFGIESVPGLVAKTDHVNAKVVVTRAKNLTGSVEDRTIKFDVTAEDDTVTNMYKVELYKEKAPDDVEPYSADIFYSEFDNSVPNGNAYLEIFNPGNQVVDLRDYMLTMTKYDDPAVAIKKNSGTGSWKYRYTSYVPGLKYADEQTWQINPRMLQPDINVNPWLQGGETFVLAVIRRGPPEYYEGMVPFKDYDVQFANEDVPGYTNPWNEYVKSSSSGGTPIPPNGNRKNCMFLFKILNDSVKLGLKPNTDPNDFELIDFWGMPGSTYWVIAGIAIPKNQTRHAFIRKPNIIKGNPNVAGSFGTNADDCEWTWTRQDDDYNDIPYPERYQAPLSNLGSHYMIEPTFYKSTVASSVYKVSDGYGAGEEIFGVTAGTTVADLFANIIKADENQTLKVKSLADGSELAASEIVSINDTLVVLSADSTNTTYYRLDVTEAGLSSNALLTSTRFDIEVQIDPKSAVNGSNEDAGVGSISGLEYGTILQFVVDNVTVPTGASMNIINTAGDYVPLNILNFDTTVVKVTINPEIYFEVIAEDGVTSIVYQLKPETSANDAFILSDMYSVVQKDNLVTNVPKGTNFQSFLVNVIPSLGATLKVVNKMGFERTEGAIREDDKIVVTSSNGLVQRVYHISMLPTLHVPRTTYLAYVLSKIYRVDQINYEIEGPSGLTELSDFYSKINPVSGATAVVVDAGGNEKMDGDLDDGDMLKVTSLDGKIVVMYSLKLDLTGVDVSSIQQIEIYPNPSNGELNINGLRYGNRVRVFNSMGGIVQDLKVQNTIEKLNLNDQPAGMYLILIEDEKTQVGCFKAVIN